MVIESELKAIMNYPEAPGNIASMMSPLCRLLRAGSVGRILSASEVS